MIILLLFSFLAGIVTILSPCILPILPIVLSGSLSGGKSRPLGVIVGFILSFTLFATFSFTLARLLGFSTEVLRNIAVILLIIFGLSLFSAKIQTWVEQLISRFNINPNPSRTGFRGGVILGITLGFIWTPCVGPILASVLTLAATSQLSLNVVLITLAYSLGTAIPLFAITYGGARVINTLPILRKRSALIQKSFGILILLTALLIFFGWDRKFQVYVLQKFPQYGQGITKIEDNATVQKQLDELKGTDEAMPKLSTMDEFTNDYPLAPNPQFLGATQWLNSEPLTIPELKGKVVLVDFWTYTCINCIRTFPHLTAWHKKYQDDGLVIIGVHSPEFEFEKSADNVLQAMKEHGITYPVVLDNDFLIWRSYNNQYWPAHYLLDKKGRIRKTHFGEGKYEEMEAKIRELLAEDGSMPMEEMVDLPTNLPLYERTPESYLGYARIDRFASPENIKQDVATSYSVPPSLPLNNFALGGTWTLTKEFAASSKGAILELNFEAKEVYLVMRAEKSAGKIKVFLNGKPVTAGEAGIDVKEGATTVTEDKLYRLIKFSAVQEGILRLEFIDNPIKVFAFTFG